MKAEILKIAGVKSEKEFYEKFPNKEAFMKVHSKEFKKAKRGASIQDKGQIKKLEQLLDFGNPPQAEIGAYVGGQSSAIGTPINLQGIYDKYDMSLTGSTNALREEAANKKAALAASTKGSGAAGGGLGDIVGKIGNVIGNMGADPVARHGKKLHQAGDGNGVPYYLNPNSANPAPGPFNGYTNPQDYAQSMYNPNAANQTQANATAAIVPPYSPSYTGPYDPAAVNAQTSQTSQTTPAIPNMNSNKKESSSFDFAKGLPLVGGIISGVQQLQEEKEQRRKAEQMRDLSGLTLRATQSSAMMQPERRRYTTADQYTTSSTQGRGTNFLAKDGMQVGGNLTEIQNMYSPGDLYSDLGFEPLNDSTTVKRFDDGGFMSQFAGAGGGDLISSGLTAGYGENAGGNIGKNIGKTAGKALGNAIVPGLGGVVGGMLGGIGGDVLGRIFDKNPQRIKKAQDQTQQNLQTAALTSGAQSVQNQYSAYIKNGGLIPYAEDGWVSHDWQPQVITTFGEHKMSDLLRPDPTMDTLRTGGHISQNHFYPQDRYALGGEIKTHWGGRAETMSQNPYLPGTGETVMFKGQTHEEADRYGRTGIGVSYGRGNHDDYTQYAEDGTEGAADVEVETNEPAVELIDPETGDKNMEVYGNLIVSRGAANYIGDPKAAGKKYKHYVRDLTKTESKQNTIVEKATDGMSSLEILTPIDQFKANTFIAQHLGGNMKLKDIAAKKTNAATYQNGTNETSEELGIVADDFAKGKIKFDKNNTTAMGKYGIEVADKGKKKKKSAPAAIPNIKWQNLSPDIAPELNAYEKQLQEAEAQQALKTMPPEYTPIQGTPTLGMSDAEIAYEKQYGNLSKNKQLVFDEGIYDALNSKKNKKKNPYDAAMYSAWFKGKYPGYVPTTTENQRFNDLVTFGNQALEYLRPSDQEALDPTQIAPEMAALAMNQLQPVEGYQMYTPMVQQEGPRISLQDQLNANQADFNAMQRQVGYNPTAMATLAAQKYAANSAILGKQTEMNQLGDYSARDKAYSTFNDAQLKNQAMLREQAAKRSAAQSATKAESLAALSSIADKQLKNKLENRKLGIMENMYKYRFDKKGRAVNMNPLMQWTNATVDQGDDLLASDSEIPTFDQYQKLVEASKAAKKKSTSRNGSIVKAIKGL